MPIYLDNRSLKEAGMDGMILKEAWLDGKQIWSAVPPFIPRVVIVSVSIHGDRWDRPSGDTEIVASRGYDYSFNVPVVATIPLVPRLNQPVKWEVGDVLPAFTKMRPAPGYRGRHVTFTEVQQEG